MTSADRLIEIFHEAKARLVGAERDQYLAKMKMTMPMARHQVIIPFCV